MSNKKVIILITGKMGSGKTTLANKFEQMGYVRKSFAAPLKKMLNPIIEAIDPKFLEVENKKHIRVGYQWLGEIGRKSNLNFWLDKAREEIDNSEHEFFVIDDCRFPNELSAFDDEKYIVFKIRMNRKSIYPPNYDDSETGLDNTPDREFDFISKGATVDNNDKMLDLLYKKAGESC